MGGAKLRRQRGFSPSSDSSWASAAVPASERGHTHRACSGLGTDQSRSGPGRARRSSAAALASCCALVALRLDVAAKSGWGCLTIVHLLSNKL